MMRSLLFLPGNREKFLAKAAGLDADGFIFDLEDSVPIKEKAAARDLLKSFVSSLPHKPVWVRVNAPETSFFAADIEAACKAAAYGVMLPKVETVAGLERADAVIADCEREAGRHVGSTRTILTLESALGVMRCLDLASSGSRTESICFGGARDGDLMTDLGCAWSNEGGTLQHARALALIAAIAAGIRAPLDGVFSDVGDVEGFERDTQLSRSMGYRGRPLIHPSQIEPANRLYSPSSAEVAESRRLVAAFDDAESAGHASLLFEGRMVDVAMAKAARTMIAWAEQSGKNQ